MYLRRPVGRDQLAKVSAGLLKQVTMSKGGQKALASCHLPSIRDNEGRHCICFNRHNRSRRSTHWTRSSAICLRTASGRVLLRCESSSPTPLEVTASPQGTCHFFVFPYLVLCFLMIKWRDRCFRSRSSHTGGCDGESRGMLVTSADLVALRVRKIVG